MKIRTIGYNAKQGVKNIGRNFAFSLASIATITACIFLFGLIFAVVINANYIIKNVEQDVTMTVFFEDGTDQATIDSVGEQIKARSEVTNVKYVSADEAWEEFQEEYFAGNEEAAAGFKDDNPLSNKANYEVTVDKVEHQTELAEYIEGLDGVSNVNYSENTTSSLSSFNRLLAVVSVSMVLMLLFVSIFLIRNTIAVGITVRGEEIGIMKLIGATNGFVRAPFYIEALLIGVIGSVIPLGVLYVLYNKTVEYVQTKYSALASVITFLSAKQVFEVLIPAGLIMGLGIGLLGSRFVLRKHLRV